jgi:hypothetical protein
MALAAPLAAMYEGKSISKLQMDIELKQTRVLILKNTLRHLSHHFTIP